ncbi:MAG: TetR/AcrR family transcriptional regulator [Eubacterium sp.]|nr:TetR/AcrR family transcriptional regulator [Eubacterium sp.]
MKELSVRQRIVYGALELFSQKGYDATSVDEIAKSIGMQGPNIYKYFKKKEDILEVLKNNYDNPYIKRFGIDPETPVWIHNSEELKMFSMKQIERTINDPMVIKLRKMGTIEQFRDAEFASNTSEYQYDSLVNLFTKIFEKLVKIGAVTEADPKILALEYMSPTSVLIQLCDRQPERKEEAMELVEKHIDFFIKTHFKE